MGLRVSGSAITGKKRRRVYCEQVASSNPSRWKLTEDGDLTRGQGSYRAYARNLRCVIIDAWAING